MIDCQYGLKKSTSEDVFEFFHPDRQLDQSFKPTRNSFRQLFYKPNGAYFVDAKFGTPPQKNRSKYENDNIIRTCNLKEIPYKPNIFLVPPPQKNRLIQKTST